MPTDDSPALEVARAYYRAWTGKDVEAAMGHLADDVVCDAPAGRIQGVQAYREFLGPFAEMLLGTELLAAFGESCMCTATASSVRCRMPRTRSRRRSWRPGGGWAGSRSGRRCGPGCTALPPTAA